MNETIPQTFTRAHANTPRGTVSSLLTGSLCRLGYCGVIALTFWWGPLFADEVWNTEQGRVIYLSEVDDTAVLELSETPGDRRYYISGLAGNYDNRSVHTGYWIGTGDAECDGQLIGPDGFSGGSWGSVTVVFHSSGFPSNWTMILGQCFSMAEQTLQGTSPLIE